MQDNDLFQLALGLSSPWPVTRSEFDAADGSARFYTLIFRGGKSVRVRSGREGCAVNDTKEEAWRQLDSFQHRTLLHAHAALSGVRGVRKLTTPWVPVRLSLKTLRTSA